MQDQKTPWPMLRKHCQRPRKMSPTWPTNLSCVVQRHRRNVEGEGNAACWCPTSISSARQRHSRGSCCLGEVQPGVTAATVAPPDRCRVYAVATSHQSRQHHQESHRMWHNVTCPPRWRICVMFMIFHHIWVEIGLLTSIRNARQPCQGNHCEVVVQWCEPVPHRRYDQPSHRVTLAATSLPIKSLIHRCIVPRHVMCPMVQMQPPQPHLDVLLAVPTLWSVLNAAWRLHLKVTQVTTSQWCSGGFVFRITMLQSRSEF